MSDPYNNNPFANNPYAPPQATADATVRRTTPDPIARLDVSEFWKERFRLIEKAGGPDLPLIRNLPSAERMKIGFNWLAYLLAVLFGPIHYFVKGLWRQGLVYLGITILVLMLLAAIGINPRAAVAIGMAAIYASRINVGYYRKVVLGNAPWL